MLRLVQALYLGIQIRIAFMETKSLNDYLSFVLLLLSLAVGLSFTSLVLGSLFSEGIMESVMVFTQTLIANGTSGILLLLWFVVGGLDSC